MRTKQALDPRPHAKQPFTDSRKQYKKTADGETGVVNAEIDELIDEAALAVIETSKKQLLTYADSAPLSHGNLKRSSRAAKPTSAPENDQAFVSLGKSRRRQLEFIERARLKATSESSEKALANERWKRTSGAREARQGEKGMAYRVRPRLSPLRSFGAK